MGKRRKRGKRKHMVVEIGKNYEFIYMYIYYKSSGIHTNLQKIMSTFVNAGRFQTKAKI